MKVTKLNIALAVVSLVLVGFYFSEQPTEIELTDTPPNQTISK